MKDGILIEIKFELIAAYNSNMKKICRDNVRRDAALLNDTHN